MSLNPFEIQLLAEERMKDAMRQSEQARLIRAVKGSGKSWRWWMAMIIMALKSLLALFIRPQS